MSNHSGIGVSPQLAQELGEFVKGSEFAVVLDIVDEKCELGARIDVLGDRSREVDELARVLASRGIGYALVRTDKDEYAFGCYTPDDASSRDKMIYASSAELVRKQLPVTSSAQRWADLDDFEDLKISGKLAKSAGTSALSEQEVERLRLGTEDKTRSAPQQQGANVSLELPDDALVAIETLKVGQLVTLVVRGEQLHMQENACGLASGEIVARFGPEPTYAVWRSGETANDGAIFIYRCPDGASTKDRMIAASCRNGVYNAVCKLTEIKSTIETSDEIEFEQDEMVSSKQPEFIGTEVRQMRRPARPGRISRR